jgi:hypothetical protein
MLEEGCRNFDYQTGRQTNNDAQIRRQIGTGRERRVGKKEQK